jgi:chitin disaccharide deacetylase
MSAAAVRPIWLCADDYGISPAVSGAIRDLVLRGRLNATSVMVAAPGFDRSEAVSLDLLNAGRKRVAIGLHVTLTAPFVPLSSGYGPLRGAAFLPLQTTLQRALLRSLSRKSLEVEIAAQLGAFADAFGRAPDFIDGHQHVQLFPQVRDALLNVAKQIAPAAWVRQCGRPPAPLGQRLADKKGLLLDMLSGTFRKRASALGIPTNPAFAGTYDFAGQNVPEFSALFPRFLEGLPAGGLIMCHPGKVDAELVRLDPLTVQREREHAYLSGPEFPMALAAAGAVLAENEPPSKG